MSESVVTLPWVARLPWKMQSILFSGLRGPDTGHCPDIKQVVKWMRAVSQEDADPTKSYMSNPTMPPVEALEKELEFCSAHFVHHFADALRVIAHGHPDQHVRTQAFRRHLYIAEELFHFVPEEPEIFAWRHRDRPSGVGDTSPQKPWNDRAWADQRAGRIEGSPHP